MELQANNVETQHGDQANKRMSRDELLEEYTKLKDYKIRYENYQFKKEQLQEKKMKTYFLKGQNLTKIKSILSEMDKTELKNEIERNRKERKTTLKRFIVVLFFLLILFTMKNISVFKSVNVQNE